MGVLLPLNDPIILINNLELFLLTISPNHPNRPHILLSSWDLSTLYQVFRPVQNEID
jgi:hypothetical protein